MTRLRAATVPPLGWGRISLALGFIGLIVVFLPILAIPLAAAGLLTGLVGLGVAQWRSSVAGSVVSCLALVLGGMIGHVPGSFAPSQTLPPTLTTNPPRVSVAPPARPNWWQAAAATEAGMPTHPAAETRKD